MRRRSLLAAPLVLAGCAGWHRGGERIVEAASGRVVTRDELLGLTSGSDFALLGELHDNPHHHVRRGELLRDLGRAGVRAAVVAEHLMRGRPLGDGPDLRDRLVAAGFDAKGWGWPLHEPLFAPVVRAGLPLAGGNLPRELVRGIARDGEPALPPELAVLLRTAPLDATAEAGLDAELVEGHCGQLPAARLGGLRRAQRARDASMALALLEAPGRPAVLVAGNGHVRLDHGVGQLLAVQRPTARIVSVAFGEPGMSAAELSCTHLWITAPATRDDPCAGMTLPASGPRRA
ncbi:MAG: ChaN family lipoprotein [Piscinibacter sp.]|nr:ChaN family lipoprotein [Piscinibacter sp.]